MQTEPEMDEEEDAYSTSVSDIHDDHNTNHLNNGPSPQQEAIVKKEGTTSPVTSASAIAEQPSSNKASIASMIDGAATNDQWPKKSLSPGHHTDTTAPALAENASVIATTTAEDAAAAAVLAGQTIKV